MPSAGAGPFAPDGFEAGVWLHELPGGPIAELHSRAAAGGTEILRRAERIIGRGIPDSEAVHEAEVVRDEVGLREIERENGQGTPGDRAAVAVKVIAGIWITDDI